MFMLAFARRIKVKFKVSLNAASRLHNNMFSSVIRGSVGFFDATPTGRILNRFSKDMDESRFSSFLSICYSLSEVSYILVLVIMLSGSGSLPAFLNIFRKF